MRLIVLSCLLHLFMVWRLVPAWSPWPLAAAALLLVLAVSAVVLPLGLRGARTRSPRWARVLTWTGYLCLGLFSSLLVLTLLREVLLLAAAIVAALVPGGLDTDTLTALSGRAVPLLALVLTAWGFLNARRTASVVRVDVPIAGLPAALEGFTIAQISDVHVGPTIGGDYVEAIVHAVNRLGADMVAVTGDLVDGRVQELAPHVAPLASLRSRHGTYFVTGNHEYYSGAAPWIAELRRLGMRVLLNEHVLLRHGGAMLLVAGVTDYSAHHFDGAQRSDPQAALAGASGEAAVKLLLAHQPRSAEAAVRAGFDLQLSGHTHGGQFWPWNHFVRFQQPFTAGLHRLGALWVYVSRGTGYWGPPKRFAAPSEITALRLVRA
ncbi:metallophosphoesterase [Piscinibacter sp. XHJ-5]|uniref:metallophosphoesterase n=1 Tax=Piscinibacter sp. XHJ-5 TaxID=3037797 RepID=UPI002453021A|nr:metallophosphoesterase [Piscinibacter sp. XHJ-5]